MKATAQTKPTCTSERFRWAILAFVSGFVIAGGTAAWIAYAEDTDIHQQSYAPERVSSDVLFMLAAFGLPVGALSVALTAGVRWTIKEGWWRSEKPEG